MASPTLFNFRNPFVPVKPSHPQGTPAVTLTPPASQRPVQFSEKQRRPVASDNTSLPSTRESQLVPHRWRSCLLVAGSLCFLAGHGRQILHWLWRCLVGGNAADVLAIFCLVAFFESAIRNFWRNAIAAIAPVCELLLKMPELAASMSDQMTAMLEEIQSMRSDVKAMKAKTNWLPGGMVA